MKCVSRRRRPILSPPGLEIMALPKRATIGPTSMTEPRRLEHFSGTRHFPDRRNQCWQLESCKCQCLLDTLTPHIPHQLDKVVDVQYVRDIVHSHLFGSEQCGADNLQHLVFAPWGKCHRKVCVLLRLQMMP